MEYKAYYLSHEGDFRSHISEEEIKAAFESRQGTLWVDICDTTDEQGKFLTRNFGFHPLAIEDCVSHLIHNPKIDDFTNHLFIIVHGINHEAESDIIKTTELAIFLGPHLVISNHSVPLYYIDSIVKLVQADDRPMKRGADFLAYTI